MTESRHIAAAKLNVLSKYFGYLSYSIVPIGRPNTIEEYYHALRVLDALETHGKESVQRAREEIKEIIQKTNHEYASYRRVPY